MAEKFRQDMPPEGGYPKFNWNRTYMRSFWSPGRVFTAGIVLPTIFGFFYNIRNQPAHFKFMSLEESDIVNALEPFLMAERDRQVLRLMKRNRELENEVMKDVPGWKTGTWYGEPVYYTLGDHWIEPHAMEVNTHLHERDWPYNFYWRLNGPWPRRFN